MVTNLLPAASIFKVEVLIVGYPEDGRRRFLRKLETTLRNYMVSLPRISQSLTIVIMLNTLEFQEECFKEPTT
jgi:hypothetical protein